MIKTIIEKMIDFQSDHQFVQHKQFIQRQVRLGKKVVIVSHGVSSVYVNRIYHLLSPEYKKSVRLVYLAPLINRMADNTTNYITNPNDFVVKQMQINSAINASLPYPLPANQDITSFNFDSDFNLNHEVFGYIDAYKDQFVQLVVNAKNQAVQPQRQWGKGLFTTTIEWPIGADIDIHVFEPRGAHVFHDSKKGNSGQIDYDVIFGYGPEHYSSIGYPEEGNYTVKINYFKGTGPQNVSLTIDTGKNCIKKIIKVEQALGSAGDSNPPYMAARIEVKRATLTNILDVFVYDE